MAKQILNEKEMDRIAEVIGEIEKKTSGEIRVMIVKRSSVAGHVQSLLWCAFIATAFLAVWFGRHDLIFFERWWLWPSIILASYLLAKILSRLEAVQRQLTPARDLYHQVWTRAELEFHREGLSGTKAHTGVLLFLSLMERSALVLADKGIADKVPPHTWDKVVNTMLSGARTGQWAEKLEQALRECGAYLAEHFPAENGKANELPNTVIVKD